MLPRRGRLVNGAEEARLRDDGRTFAPMESTPTSVERRQVAEFVQAGLVFRGEFPAPAVPRRRQHVLVAGADEVTGVGGVGERPCDMRRRSVDRGPAPGARPARPGPARGGGALPILTAVRSQPENAKERNRNSLFRVLRWASGPLLGLACLADRVGLP